jgi:hypothetical protein
MHGGSPPSRRSLQRLARAHQIDAQRSANPAGWNLRNEISHGFVDDGHAPIAVATSGPLRTPTRTRCEQGPILM